MKRFDDGFWEPTPEQRLAGLSQEELLNLPDAFGEDEGFPDRGRRRFLRRLVPMCWESSRPLSGTQSARMHLSAWH